MTSLDARGPDDRRSCHPLGSSPRSSGACPSSPRLGLPCATRPCCTSSPAPVLGLGNWDRGRGSSSEPHLASLCSLRLSIRDAMRRPARLHGGIRHVEKDVGTMIVVGRQRRSVRLKSLRVGDLGPLHLGAPHATSSMPNARGRLASVRNRAMTIGSSVVISPSVKGIWVSSK